MPKPTYDPKYPKPLIADALADLGNLINGVHSACESVKPIGLIDFDNLVDSIKKHGLVRPIEVNKKRQMVDGRCRVLACYVAGVQITEADIVETAVPPWAIADSNNARRHLTLDQKTMAATHLLKKQRAVAALKKKQGAVKGNKARQAKLGTDAVPSEASTPVRAPRSIEIVASQENVPRDRLAMAEKVKKANPKLAEDVENGEVSLEEAARKVGVNRSKKRVVPTLRSNNKVLPNDEQPERCSAAPTGPSTLFDDEWTSICDAAEGIRVIKNTQCTVFTHKATSTDTLVFMQHGKWVIASKDDIDSKTWKSRKKAESHARTLLAEAVIGDQSASEPAS